MSSQQYFEQNKYVVLERALNQDRCRQLTDHMFDLHNQGKLTKDDQCPQSDAIYGDPVFDKLLADFAKPIGNHVGKQLIPTYTYARIYRPGEILKKHKDRPSCEISATLTLGFDAKFNWPIYFDEEKELLVTLEPGDLAVYKGCEICHWRKPFKGNWHVQVFLHYVDADGPYKEHALDKRPQLGTTAETKVNTNAVQDILQDVEYRKPMYDGVIIPSKDNILPGYTSIYSDNAPSLMFTKDECEKIVSRFQEAYPSTASVGGGDDSAIKRHIRSANIFNIENTTEHRWIFDKLATITSIVNSDFFDYDLVGITHSLQLIHYSATDDVPGHYDWHVDAGKGESATRKISLTVQLTDPDKYKGCDLEVFDHGGQITAPRDQGAISLFPSYMPHRVTPIEYGERYALVIWIHGARRFR
jgi:predicted 2-oxoglutarate/Fe(II)-dependent dioxygenase YbiX/alkylated DNA repair dioxygenase AlkB